MLPFTSLRTANQALYEKRFIGHLLSGNVTRGVVFVHMEDMVTALALAVEQRKVLPQVTTLLIGESETPSYDELQRTISRQFYGQDGKGIKSPPQEIGQVWLPAPELIARCRPIPRAVDGRSH